MKNENDLKRMLSTLENDLNSSALDIFLENEKLKEILDFYAHHNVEIIKREHHKSYSSSLVIDDEIIKDMEIVLKKYLLSRIEQNNDKLYKFVNSKLYKELILKNNQK